MHGGADTLSHVPRDVVIEHQGAVLRLQPLVKTLQTGRHTWKTLHMLDTQNQAGRATTEVAEWTRSLLMQSQGLTPAADLGSGCSCCWRCC